MSLPPQPLPASQVRTADVDDGRPPLCVDLDGTLIRSDTLVEGFLALLKAGDSSVLRAPLWLLRGRAHLKEQVALRATLDPSVLPFHQPFLSYLEAQRAAGRRLVLVTGANQRVAETVAEHLGIFDSVIAGDGQDRMTGGRKRARLEAAFPQGFDYAGNSHADLSVWPAAREAVLVNCPRLVAARARAHGNVAREFTEGAPTVRTWLRALRVHQWSKNLIVFLPALASHQLFVPSVIGRTLLMFICFCLMASGTYVLNDLLDLTVDRRHAVKRHRPFAAGDLDIRWGLVLAPLLIAAALGLAALLPGMSLGVTALYLIVTLSYSYRFKQVMLVDVFVLASLYTLRLIAGHEATGIRYSHWLLGFSIFLFLSLSLLKRAAELRSLKRSRAGALGRGYVRRDLPMVENLGLLSGGLTVMVLAMYITSPDVLELYEHPIVLHFLCPLVLYWIGRIWMLTHRGEMHHDPVLFAMRDRSTYATAALGALIVIAATISW